MSTVRQHIEIDSLGEGIETFPTSISWNSTYEGRMVYIDDIDMYLIGGSAGWKQLDEKPYSEVPQSGLVSEWTMEDVNGTTVTDSAGIYDGTIVGTVFQDTGKVGSSLNFQSTQSATASIWKGAAVDIGTNITDFKLSDFSVSLWLKVNDSTHTEVFFATAEYASGTSNSGCQIYHDTNNNILVNFLNNGNNIYTSSNTAAVGAWNHIAVTRNSTSMKIYINNALGFDGATVTPVYDTNVITSIGGYYHTGNAAWYNSMNGNGIDQARFYNRALSSAEVSQLYNFGSGN